MLKQLLRITVLVFVVVSATYAATLPAGFTETAISGLSDPTAMDIAPDGRIFVCQQGGSLRVIKNGVLLTTPFITLTVDPGISLPSFFVHSYPGMRYSRRCFL